MDDLAILHGHPVFEPFHLPGFGLGNPGAPHESSPGRDEAGRLLAALGRRAPALCFDGTLDGFRSFAVAAGFAIHAAAHTPSGRWVVLLESGGFLVAFPAPEGPRFQPVPGTIGSTEGLDLRRFLDAVDHHIDGQGLAAGMRLPWRLAPSVLDRPRGDEEIVPQWWPASGLADGVLDALALLLVGRPGMPCSVLEQMGGQEGTLLTVTPGVPYGPVLSFHAQILFHNARLGIARRPPIFGHGLGDKAVHALLRSHHLFHHAPRDGVLEAPPLASSMPMALTAHQRLQGERWLAAHLPSLLASLPPQGSPS